MDRRAMIKSIGAAICAGLVPPFIPRLLPEESFTMGEVWTFTDMYDHNHAKGDQVIVSDGDWGYGVRTVVSVDKENGVIVLE